MHVTILLQEGAHGQEVEEPAQAAGQDNFAGPGVLLRDPATGTRQKLYRFPLQSDAPAKEEASSHRGQGASGNVVAGNRMGTDAVGTAALGNDYGVRITRAAGNLFGGTAPGAGNVISGNETGIYIAGRAAGGNRVQGNTMGLDATGMVVLPNEQGIYVNGAPGNLIGAPTTAARNVIAARDAGITIRGAEADGNRVQGNAIGLDVTGVVIPERVNAGVYVIDAINNVVGGPQEGQGNIIAARTYGVRVVGPEAATNQVEGNVLDVLEDEVN